MFLHIPGNHPIFVENAYIVEAKESFHPFSPDPGTDPQGQTTWKMSVYIIFSDNLIPKIYDIEKIDYDRNYITDQFFGWLAYVQTISREFEYWRLQINNIVINHTGFRTFDFSRNLYPIGDLPIR
jgi:hypothetical protein